MQTCDGIYREGFMSARLKCFVLMLMPLLAALSCSRSLDERDYMTWVNDYENGLHVGQTVGDYRFDLLYTPPDYVWLQYRDRPRGMQDSTQLYTLTIAPASGADLMEFGAAQDEAAQQRKQYYFSYTFQNSITLEENGEVFPCVMYHFERPVDLKPGRTFVLGFQMSRKPADEVSLVIDSEMFGAKPVHIKVSKANIPALQL
jgi:hypothetical protein